MIQELMHYKPLIEGLCRCWPVYAEQCRRHCGGIQNYKYQPYIVDINQTNLQLKSLRLPDQFQNDQYRYGNVSKWSITGQNKVVHYFENSKVSKLCKVNKAKVKMCFSKCKHCKRPCNFEIMKNYDY